MDFASLRRVPRALWWALGGVVAAGVLMLATAEPEDAAPVAVVPASAPVVAAAPSVAPEPVPANGLALVGVLPGGAVFAEADGGQRRVATGREVRPGLVLMRTERDRAVLRRGSQEVVLVLPQAGAQAPAAVAPSALPEPGSDTRAADAGLALALEPERGPDGGVAGWRVRTLPPILASAGARVGDLLLTVNGRSPQSPAEIANLGREASVSETLVLGVSRDGKPLELRLER